MGKRKPLQSKEHLRDNEFVKAFCKRFRMALPAHRDIWSGDLVFDTMTTEIGFAMRKDLGDIRRRGLSMLRVKNQKELLKAIWEKQTGDLVFDISSQEAIIQKHKSQHSSHSVVSIRNCKELFSAASDKTKYSRIVRNCRYVPVRKLKQLSEKLPRRSAIKPKDYPF